MNEEEGAVLGANEISPNSSGDRMFADTFCDLIAFDLEFKEREKFRFEDFAAVTGWKKSKRFRNACSAKYKGTDYHLHLRWRIRPPESVSVSIDFVKGYKAPDEDEIEPFAETFVGWINQFIVDKEMLVEMHADFAFPHDLNRQLRFPLPMRAPIGPRQAEVEIDGISFRLSPPVEGIEKIWLTQDERLVSVHLHADRTLNIASLEPRKEIFNLSRILETLFERKESQGKLQ